MDWTGKEKDILKRILDSKDNKHDQREFKLPIWLIRNLYNMLEGREALIVERDSAIAMADYYMHKALYKGQR